MFLIIVLAGALSLASCAAYFSIYGLANIFAATFWPVVIMGSALEIGKLIAASFVYRHWNDITFLLKSYLIIAILILMLITSMGIFGFLSSGYQTDSLPLKQMEEQMILLEKEEQRIDARIIQIDEDIGRISANYITKRMELIEKYKPERESIGRRQKELSKEKYELSSNTIEQKAHTGPIVYIAESLGRPIDDAIKYMIYLIMFVFDPLAVVLTIAANIILRKKEEPKVIQSKHNTIEDIIPTYILEEDEIDIEVEDISIHSESIEVVPGESIDNQIHKATRGNSTVYVSNESSEPSPLIVDQDDLDDYLAQPELSDDEIKT